VEDCPGNSKQLLEDTIKKESEVVLIVNTHSRKGKHFYAAAKDEFIKRGISIVSSYLVQYPESLSEVVQDAINRGHKFIVVGGGDGTISSVVDYFAYKDVVLGILPLGTANSFARSLGIPLDLKGAIDVIVNGKVIDVDLGKVGDDYFSNAVAIGFTATVARNISPKLKRYFGVLAYVLTGMKVFFSLKPFECILTISEKTYTINTHQIIVSNAGQFGVTELDPDASPDNRELIVFAMDTQSRWQMLVLWAAFLLKKSNIFSQSRFFRTKKILLEAKPPQIVEVDGELTTHTPVCITLASGALKVMAPTEFVICKFNR
jgi:YegS/Rv2252/BmrU family lipid kinase